VHSYPFVVQLHLLTRIKEPMATKRATKKTGKKTAPPAPSKFEGEAMASAAAEYADDKKAEDIVILDMREISPVTDYMVVCSASSLPQLRAVRDESEDKFRENHHVRPLAGDRNLESGWLIQHYGDVMVHIFLPDKREFYALEDLYNDAPRVPWAPKPALAPKGATRKRSVKKTAVKR
jgi:ribosome-associated protein